MILTVDPNLKMIKFKVCIGDLKLMSWSEKYYVYDTLDLWKQIYLLQASQMIKSCRHLQY